MTRIAVIGSRTFGKKYQYETKEMWLDIIKTWFRFLHGDLINPLELDEARRMPCETMHSVLCQEISPGDIIVSGGALGADLMAKTWAEVNGYIPITHEADWERYGRKRAGFIRNGVVIGDSDRVIAFWDSISPGSQHTLSLARQRGLPVKVHQFTS